MRAVCACTDAERSDDVNSVCVCAPFVSGGKSRIQTLLDRERPAPPYTEGRTGETATRGLYKKIKGEKERPLAAYIKCPEIRDAHARHSNKRVLPCKEINRRQCYCHSGGNARQYYCTDYRQQYYC